MACFTKAFGIVFLGEPRTDQAGRSRGRLGHARAHAHLRARLCGRGISRAAVRGGDEAGHRERHGFGEHRYQGDLSLAIEPLRWVVPASGIFVLIVGLLVGLRHRLLQEGKSR